MIYDAKCEYSEELCSKDAYENNIVKMRMRTKKYGNNADMNHEYKRKCSRSHGVEFSLIYGIQLAYGCG